MLHGRPGEDRLRHRLLRSGAHRASDSRRGEPTRRRKEDRPASRELCHSRLTGQRIPLLALPSQVAKGIEKMELKPLGEANHVAPSPSSVLGFGNDDEDF